MGDCFQLTEAPQQKCNRHRIFVVPQDYEIKNETKIDIPVEGRMRIYHMWKSHGGVLPSSAVLPPISGDSSVVLCRRPPPLMCACGHPTPQWEEVQFHYAAMGGDANYVAKYPLKMAIFLEIDRLIKY